jgi:hypothetical protein
LRTPVIVRYTQLLVLLLLGLSSAMPVLAQGWQWGRANTGASVDGWAVATDKYGNVFCAGDRSGLTDATFGTYTVPYTGGVANFQCVIVKYDASGNFQWAGGNSSGNANLTGIATDPYGDVYMFGSFVGSIKVGTYTLTNTRTNGDYEYFLAKYDPLGNVLWAVAAGNIQSAFVNAGGIAFTVGLGGIATDAFGNVYITGNFHEKAITIGPSTLVNADASGLTDDIFLVKYDPLGNVVWAKSTGGNLSDDAYAITVTPAGDIYLAGDFASPSVTFGPSVIANTAGTYQTAFIARFDASGNPLWASASGGAGPEYAAGLTSDIAGNVYMIGGLKDNSISFNGTVITNPYTGQYVSYLVKFDPGNNVSWYKTIGSPVGDDVWGVSVAVSRCGYVWISGGMPLSVTDAGGTVPGQVSIDGRIFTTPAGSTTDPIFVAGYTTDGNFADGQVLQSGSDDQDGLACDLSGNVFLCGDYVGTSPIFQA